MLESLRHVASHASLYAIMAKEKMNDALAEELGSSFDYFIDLEKQHLEFTSEKGTVTGRAHMVASVAVDPTTYLWSYHQMFEQQRAYSPVPGLLEAFALEHRLPDFSYAAHEYVGEGEDQQTAMASVLHTIGQAAVEILGPEYGYYISRSGAVEGNYIVSAVEGFDRDLLQVGLEDALVKLPRLLGAGENLEWRLGGLARLLGGSLVSYPAKDSATARLWKLAGADGRFLWIETDVDELERLTHVRVHGVNPAEDAPEA